MCNKTISIDNWFYEIGQTIADKPKSKERNLTIIDKKIISAKRTYRNGKSEGTENVKYYKYHCHVCGDEDWLRQSLLKSGSNCKYCMNKKVIQGMNDVATLRPDIVPYFDNLEDAQKYSIGSNKIVPCHCIECGIKKKLPVTRLVKNGIGECDCYKSSCSFSEKFVKSLLKQIGVDYIYQAGKKTFDWCLKYKYDFYLPDYNLIIETHGRQHYERAFYRSVEEEQSNDNLKQELALSNNINYLVLDCRESTLEWLKKSILKSELFMILNVNGDDIKWNDCLKDTLSKSIMQDVCKMWSEYKERKEYVSTSILSKHFKVNETAIAKYLKEGTILGLCDYDASEAMKDSKSKPRIKEMDIKKVSEYWENSPDEEKNTTKLSEVFGLNRPVIVNLLKLGTKKGYCHYDGKAQNQKQGRINGTNSGKKVTAYNPNGEYVGTYYSMAEAARRLTEQYSMNFSDSKISSVCNGNRKHHRKFTFRYADEDCIEKKIC